MTWIKNRNKSRLIGSRALSLLKTCSKKSLNSIRRGKHQGLLINRIRRSRCLAGLLNRIQSIPEMNLSLSKLKNTMKKELRVRKRNKNRKLLLNSKEEIMEIS